MKHCVARAALALGLLGICTGTAWAVDLSWDKTCGMTELEGNGGVLLTQVPEPWLGTLQLEGRHLAAGDALTEEQLMGTVFVPAEGTTGDGVVTCLYLGEAGAAEAALTLHIGKNQAPVAEDSSFRTYKNIPGQVPLTVSDPEGDDLTVTIVKQPRRGAVSVGADGTVTYTPGENKVGRDSFLYTVTDAAGNVSEEATVRIEILKPSQRPAYGDMTGDAGLLAATWLREEGIFSGEMVGGQALFAPERTVTQGEFLAMCSGLLEEADLSQTGLELGDIPAWLEGCVTQALGCGYLQSMTAPEGLEIQPEEDMTQAAAAQTVGKMLGLEAPVVGADQGLCQVLSQQGIYTVQDPDAALTRRDAAQLLWGAAQYGQAHLEQPSLLAWAKK